MPSALIGALRATLGLDTANFEKGADRAVKKMDAVSRAGYNTGRTLRGIANLAATTGLALAGAFTAQSVKAALDYAASLGEVATQLGVTTTELQVYRYAATQVNLTQEQMDKGLGKLTLSIGKAAAGAKTEARAFETLGIAVKDAEGNIRPTGDVLLDFADKLRALPDPASRAAAANALLGRQLGQKFIPFLEGGSEGLRQFAKDAEAAGLVIAEGDITKADETADKIEALTQQLKVNFSKEVATNADAILGLTSAIISLVGWLFKAASAYTGFFKRVGKEAANAINQGAKQPIGIVGGISRFIQSRFGNRGAKPPPAPAPAAPPMEPVSLTGLFGGGGGGGRRGRSGRSGPNIVEETAKVRENLADIRTDIEEAFDTRNLPRSTQEAEELRTKLADISAEARKAGVPMSQFSGEVAGLNARIAELETEGLAREAEEFSRKVIDMGKAVDEVDASAMTPLARTLGEIDDRYEDLADRIREQITENEALAGSNEKAARAMADLRTMLGQLETAHQAATEAALAQVAAEQQLRDLAAQQTGQDIQDQITDLSRARGDQGLFTPAQQQLQDTERQLQQERLDALIRLKEFEDQLRQAELEGDTLEAARLQGLIGLAGEYYDLVSDTTAQQIVTSQRLQDAFTDFTEGLSDALFNMVTQFDFSLEGVLDTFLGFLNQAFLKPATDSLAGSVTGFLKGLFAGGFATGGTIPRGHWGIVGEKGPEPAFAGDSPLSVLPNDTLGGARPVFQISVNGKMSDREARRTGSQIGAAAAKRYADARKAGIAG